MDRSKYMQETVWTQHSSFLDSEYEEIYDNLFLPDGSKSEVFALVEGADQNIELSPISKRMTDATTTTGGTQRTASGNSSFRKVIQPVHSHYKTIDNCDDLMSHFQNTPDTLRVMHVRQKYSQAPLRVTQEVFHDLLSHAYIFDAVRDSILYMGRRSLEVEVAPPRPRSSFISSNDATDSVQGHEVVYGLRFFQRNYRTDGGNPWSLRQCVVYNKTLDEPKAATWLFVSLPDVAQKAFNKYLERYHEQLPSNPFDIHLLFLGVVINLWRPYLVHLATRIDDHTQRLMLASPSGQGPLDLAEDGGERQRQQLKELEDEITDGLLSLDSTEDTLQTLLKLAKALSKDVPDARTFSHSTQINIMDAFEEKLKDVDMLRKRIIALREKLASTTQVVSTFLDLGNGYALKTLAEQAHEESHKMAQLSEKANRDAAAVKALTVITLIYLPVTVVLNFFSASFIDTSTGDMKLVGKWWLFLVVGLPLTAFTIYAWRMWIRFHGTGSRPAWRSIFGRKPATFQPPMLPDNSSDLEKCVVIRRVDEGAKVD